MKRVSYIFISVLIVNLLSAFALIASEEPNRDNICNVNYLYIKLLTELALFRDNPEIFHDLFRRLNIKKISHMISVMRKNVDDEFFKNISKENIIRIKKAIEQGKLPVPTWMIKGPYADEIRLILNDGCNKEKQISFLNELLK